MVQDVESKKKILLEYLYNKFNENGCPICYDKDTPVDGIAAPDCCCHIFCSDCLKCLENKRCPTCGRYYNSCLLLENWCSNLFRDIGNNEKIDKNDRITIDIKNALKALGSISSEQVDYFLTNPEAFKKFSVPTNQSEFIRMLLSMVSTKKAMEFINSHVDDDFYKDFRNQLNGVREYSLGDLIDIYAKFNIDTYTDLFTKSIPRNQSIAKILLNKCKSLDHLSIWEFIMLSQAVESMTAPMITAFFRHYYHGQWSNCLSRVLGANPDFVKNIESDLKPYEKEKILDVKTDAGGNITAIYIGEYNKLGTKLVYLGYWHDQKYDIKGELFLDEYYKMINENVDGLDSLEVYYKGEFKDGIRQGYGETRDGYNRLIYKGQFVDGKYNGKGTLYYPKGNMRYSGDFVDGKYDGEGKEYDFTGMMKYRGFYKQGKPCKEGYRYLSAHYFMEVAHYGYVNYQEGAIFYHRIKNCNLENHSYGDLNNMEYTDDTFDLFGDGKSLPECLKEEKGYIYVNPIVLDSIVERIRNFTEGIRRQNKSSKLIFYGDYKNNNSDQLLSVSLQHIYPIIQKDECLRELYFNYISFEPDLVDSSIYVETLAFRNCAFPIVTSQTPGIPSYSLFSLKGIFQKVKNLKLHSCYCDRIVFPKRELNSIKSLTLNVMPNLNTIIFEECVLPSLNELRLTSLCCSLL